MFFYAQINDDSIVIAVTQTSGEIDAVNMIRLDEYDISLVGKIYNNDTGDFEDSPPSPDDRPRHITVGAFYDRFGAAKWNILADTDPTVQAVIKDSSVRKYIDLDNPDLPAGLAIIQSAGHDIDPDAILGDPIEDKERP